MAGKLEGKVAVVTGAAQGIGRAIAERYAAEGATVVVSDVDGAGAERVAASLDGGGGGSIACDVTQEDQVEALIAGTVERHGRVDVAVANAGVGHVAPLVGQSLEDWRKVTSVNLDGVFLTLTKAGAQMVQQGGGTLVTIASVTSFTGAALIGSYAAAKAGALNVTRTINTELRPHGVRANAICPAFIETTLVNENKSKFEELLGLESFDAVIEQKQGRYGTVEEVASLATFLASDRSAFCAGGYYVLDGGLRASLL